MPSSSGLHLPSSLCTFPQKNTVSTYFKSNEDDFSQLCLGIRNSLSSHSIRNIGCQCWLSDLCADMLTKPCLLVGMSATCWQMSCHHVVKICQPDCPVDMSAKCQPTRCQHFGRFFWTQRKYTKALQKSWGNVYFIVKSCEKGFALVHL